MREPRTTKRSTRAVSSTHGQLWAERSLAVADMAAFQRFTRGLDDDSENGRLSDPYRQILSAFTGMCLAGQLLAKVPVELWDLRRGEIVTEKATGPRGDLLRLLKRPNPAQDWVSFVETAVIWRHHGNADFELVEPDGLGIPKEIWIVPPRKAHPHRREGDSKRTIRGWTIYDGLRERPIPPERLMRLQFAPTEDPYVGASAFEPGRLMAESDYLAGVYQRSTMENGGTAAAVMTYQGNADGDVEQFEEDPELRRKLEDELRRRFGGPKASGRVLILTRNWNYQNLGFRPRDIEFLALKKFSVNEWARLLRLPPLYLASFDDIGWGENSTVRQEGFAYQINTIPIARQWASAWNTGFIKRVDPDLELVFNFDNIESLRESMSDRADTVRKFYDMKVPFAVLDERFDLGLFDEKLMPWAKQAWGTMGEVPIGGAIADDGRAAPADDGVPMFSDAQAAQIVAIVKDVAANALPRDAGLGQLVTLFGLSDEQAEHIMGSAGQEKPKKEEPAPTPAATDPLASPADPAIAPPPPPPPPPDDLTEEAESLEPAARANVIELATRATPRAPSRRVVEATRVAFLSAHSKHEHPLAKKVARALNDLRVGVLRRLNRIASGGSTRDEADKKPLSLTRAEIDAILEEIDEAVVVKALRPSMRDAFRSGALTQDEILKAIGVPAGDLTAFQRNRLPKIQDGYVDARLGTGEPTRVTADLRRAVNDVIVQSITDGASLRDTIVGIRQAFSGEASLGRARNIARTETSIAMGAARFAAYGEHGVERHGWMHNDSANPRETHLSQDGQIVEVGQPFRNGQLYAGDPDGGAEENCNCVLPGTLVSGSFVAGLKALYAGEAIEIQTRRGHRVAVTVNHPVATPRGFLPAHALQEGDHVICERGDAHWSLPLRHDEEQQPVARVEDVYDALAVGGAYRTHRPTALDLDGDAEFLRSEIHLVERASPSWLAAARDPSLVDEAEATRQQRVSQFAFVAADRAVQAGGLPCGDGARPALLRNQLAALRPPGRAHLALDRTAVLTHSAPLQNLSFGLRSHGNLAIAEHASNHIAGAAVLGREREFALAGQVVGRDVALQANGQSAERIGDAAKLDLPCPQEARHDLARAATFLRELVDRHAALVAPDEIIKVRRFKYVGHVYDLQTTVGYFNSGGVLSRNCRCSNYPVNRRAYAESVQEAS